MPLPRVNRQPTETALLAGARRGNADALTALYAEHSGTLLRLATRITGSPADAEDLLHDLFVGLPELLGRYEHEDRLGAWLRGVITRMALGRLRQGKRRETLASSSASPRAAQNDPWNAVDLERAIAALPEVLRVVFVLKQVEGYAHEEIATMLGISSGASRVRHLRALRQLRVSLRPSR